MNLYFKVNLPVVSTQSFVYGLIIINVDYFNSHDVFFVDEDLR